MKIIATVSGGSCGNGIDCDTIYETDGADLLVRGRKLTDVERADLGLSLPEHEDLILIERRLIR